MTSQPGFSKWPGATLLAGFGVPSALAVLACGGDSAFGTAWDGGVRDSAGVEIVENFGEPLWPEGPAWEFTEVLRIGAASGAPEYEFGRISGFVVLSDGRFVVADALGHHLRFFSPEGIHERTVGREGKGPSEFGSGPLWLVAGPGDTLLVIDPANQRGHTIAPDGTWLDSFSTLPRGAYRMGLWAHDPGSGRVVSYHIPVRLPDGTLADTLDIVLERDVHGAVLDTLVRTPSYLTFSPGEPTAPFNYFIGVPDINLCGDILVTGLNDTYRFLWHRSDVGLDRIVSLARAPLAMTDDDRLPIMRGWDQLLRENNVPLERATQFKSSLYFADTYPAYTLFTCGPSSTLLVQRVRPLRSLDTSEQEEIRLRLGRPPGTAEWDVFDREGRYLGAAEIPGTAWVNTWHMLQFSQDRETGTWYMYSVWSDEQDVEYVVGWRVDGRMPA